MTTKSVRPVSRETTALVRERGCRPIIVTIQGGTLTLRAKGLRHRYELEVGAAWSLAAKIAAEAKRREKAAARKARRA